MGHKVIMTCVQQGGRKRPQRKCSNCLMETTEANTRGTIDVADCFEVGGLLARLTCSVSNWTLSRKLFGLKKKRNVKTRRYEIFYERFETTAVCPECGENMRTRFLL